MIEALLQAERLLVHGLVDQAEQIYRRTLDSDPLNAIAMVGLARVALERADDALAYRHACAALEIDRQNAAALRLEARLSEVLLARGEAVERPAWLTAGAVSAHGAAHQPPAGPVSTEPPRESERVMVARNPSMADHRQRMEQQASDHDTTAAGPGAAPAPAVAPDRAGAHQPAAAAAEPVAAPRRRPRGILRRLLGG